MVQNNHYGLKSKKLHKCGIFCGQQVLPNSIFENTQKLVRRGHFVNLCVNLSYETFLKEFLSVVQSKMATLDIHIKLLRTHL